MANNFHDVHGLLIAGIDLHFALLVPGIPLPLPPTPVPRFPHLNLLHPFRMGGNQKATVQFNGVNAVAHWHQPKILWPHLNLPFFPIDILIPLYVGFGVQTAWLPRGTVLVEDEPAAVANIYGPMSINLDCWDLSNIPSSLVVQPGTVQTTPTLADYGMGLRAFAVDFALNLAMAGVFRFGGRAFGAQYTRYVRPRVQRLFAGPAGVARRAASAAGRGIGRGAGRIPGVRKVANSVSAWARRPTPVRASAWQRRLAALPGSGPVQRNARREVAWEYIRNRTPDDGRAISGFRNANSGFDWNHPVQEVRFTPDTHSQLHQFSNATGGVPDGRVGRWVDPLGGQTPGQLGLRPTAVEEGLKAPVVLQPPQTGGAALEGRAAPVWDTWTGGGSDPAWSNGGGTQWHITGSDHTALVEANRVPPP